MGLFGTDGVRGTVGRPPMVPDALVRIGHAIGTVLGGPGHEVVVGKDTRLSGYMVESAIEAGLAATGVDTALTGPLPTSAVAHLATEEQAAAGIVISASHNPFHDNGIKLFDTAGNKFGDELQQEVERVASAASPAWASEPGKARRIDDAPERYVDFCLAAVPGIDLHGMNIVVDAANGAGYHVAPMALDRTGAQLLRTGCRPDGRNINVGCGALEPGHAARLVTGHNFDVAVILDGDADRLVMVDATGRVVDGDAYLFAMCTCLCRAGRPPAGVVGTMISSRALEDAVVGMGIGFARAAVGDRHLADEMRARGWPLGAEPSGHIMLHELHGTGDGLLAALALLDALAGAGLRLDEALAGYAPLPVHKEDLRCPDPHGEAARLAGMVAQQRGRDGVGLVVLRPSGTEPALRLQVEARTRELATEVAQAIKAQVARG